MVGEGWGMLGGNRKVEQGGGNLDPSVDVAEVQLPVIHILNDEEPNEIAPVKVEEDWVIIDIGGHVLCFWPW